MTTEILESLQTEQLDTPGPQETWVWDGLIGIGQVTLLTSVPKLGKTTLLGHLLVQRKAGGSLIERPVAQGRSAIVSEESPALWRQRHQLLGFGPNRFFCRPFKMTPSAEQWTNLIDHLLALHGSEAIDLVIIDPLSYFLPRGAENEASLLLETLRPLRRLTEAGLAVVLVHHPRKAPAFAGLAARGSTLLVSFVDVPMEMCPVMPGDAADRRRRLMNYSRDPVTPRVLLFELSANGRTLPRPSRRRVPKLCGNGSPRSTSAA